jgi:hypothetical protein
MSSDMNQAALAPQDYLDTHGCVSYTFCQKIETLSINQSGNPAIRQSGNPAIRQSGRSLLR